MLCYRNTKKQKTWFKPVRSTSRACQHTQLEPPPVATSEVASSIPFLVNQLRRTGFECEILINPHFNYSAPQLKNEMKALQNRMLRIIVSMPRKHSLSTVSPTSKSSLKRQLLARSITYSMTNPIHLAKKKHPRSEERVLKVPRAKTEHNIVPNSVRTT